MATSTLTAAMPALELTEGESLVLEAIDPTTGNAVAGVVCNNFIIYATDQRQDDPGELTLEKVYLSPTDADASAPSGLVGPVGQHVKATALFVDGPCRLQKRVLTFDQQPPEFLTCGGMQYIVSAHQGIEYINYVVRGGANDTGATGIIGQRDVFNAWSQIHAVLNRTVPHKVNRVRNAGRRIRRAVR